MRPRASRCVVLGLLAVVALPSPAWADVPDLMSYQGVLTLPSGRSPQDGSYSLTFRVLDDVGGEKFAETLSVELRGGLYGVLLGGSSSTSLSSAFSEAPRFLEVTIVSGAEPGITGAVLDLQRISPVPFALTATHAEATIDPPDPIPAGLMILWDQPTGCGGVADLCPCGWDEATEFRGRTARGADTAERWADLPDDPGVTMGAPEDTGMYGDTLGAAEAPDHLHTSQEDSTVHNHSVTVDALATFGNASINTDNFGWEEIEHNASGPDGDHTHTTAASGGDAAHIHAGRRVLFCRKQ